MGESSRPRIFYPHLPVEPFKSTLIVELPDHPQRPELYTIEEFEEEKTKIWELQVELNNQYEEKIKKTILYLVDKIDWPAFYDQLVGVLDMWNEIKSNEDTLKIIVQKWSGRDKYITLICISLITLSCEQIEKKIDITSNMTKFDEKRVSIQKRIMICLSKYMRERERDLIFFLVHSKILVR